MPGRAVGGSFEREIAEKEGSLSCSCEHFGEWAGSGSGQAAPKREVSISATWERAIQERDLIRGGNPLQDRPLQDM